MLVVVLALIMRILTVFLFPISSLTLMHTQLIWSCVKVTKTLYVKQGAAKQFAIVDAGMTDLIRPALYQAYHKIENISSEEALETYDVVGPICESSDVFAKSVDLNKVKRGDFLAIRSAGAYGEIMASQYNCRTLPQGYIKEDL